MASQLVQPNEYEPSEMARRAAIITGSNNLHRALWREHPRRMSKLFIAGKAEGPREIVIVHAPAVVVPFPVPAAQPVEREPSFGAAAPKISIASRLIEAVAAEFGLSYGEVIGTGRTRRFVAARAVVARILRDRGWSTTQIGRWLHRDHSTIIHLLAHWPQWMKSCPEAAAFYERERVE